MKTILNTSLLFITLALLVTTGCTSKKVAKANARAAFLAGQNQALAGQLAAQRQPRAPGNTVSILGPVKVDALAWTPDLTLTKAIFAAEYFAAGEPTQIFITRGGEQIPVDVQAVLNGNDIPLQAGDVVELKP